MTHQRNTHPIHAHGMAAINRRPRLGRFGQRLLIAMLATLTLHGAAQAGAFYKWTDAQGVTHYSEEPPPSGKSDRLDLQLPPPGTNATPAYLTQKPVVIYTTTWCGVCRTAKQYFAQKGIAYTEYDVENSSKGKADYQRMQGKGVPIILVGEQRMNGFSAERFEAMRK